MSLYLMVNREDELIDSYRPQVDNTSPLVTQADTPGEDLQTSYAMSRPELPDATVGGKAASKEQNGFSTGFKSLFNRQQPFSGAVAKPPAITNAVQGEVGMNNRQGKLYAGVMSQLVQYSASQASYAAAYVGNVPVTKVPTERGNNA